MKKGIHLQIYLAFFFTSLIYSQNLTVNQCHKGGVIHFSYSEDGSFFVTAGYENTVRLWDAKSKKLLRVYENEFGPLFFENGDKLLISNEVAPPGKFFVKIRDIKSNKIVDKIEDVACFAVNSDRTLMFVGYGNYLARKKIIETSTRKVVYNFDVEDRCKEVIFHPDNKSFFSLSTFGVLMRIDLQTGKVISNYKNANQPEAVALSPDGNLLVAAGVGKSARLILIDVATGKVLNEIETSGSRLGLDIEFSPDGKLIAASAWLNAIGVLDVETFSPRMFLELGTKKLNTALSFSPDGKTIARYDNNFHQDVDFWDLDTGEKVFTLDKNEYDLGKIEIAPDGRAMMIEHKGYGIEVFDLKFMQPLYWLPGESFPIRSHLFGPDEDYFVSVGKNNSLYLRNIYSGEKLIELRNRPGYIQTIDFSPNGKLIACGAGGDIVVWDVSSENPIAEIEKAHTAGIQSLSFSHDSRFIFSYGGDGKIIIWDVETRQKLKTIKYFHPLVDFSYENGSKKLFCLNQYRLVVLDSQYAQLKFIDSLHNSNILGLGLSREGDKLVISGARLQVRDADSGKLLGEVSDKGPFKSACFTANDSMLLTTKADNTIQFWDSESLALKASLYFFDKGSAWVLVTGESFYAANEKGEKYVHWVDELKVIDQPSTDSRLKEVNIYDLIK